MTAAAALADALRPFVGGELPVRLVAWDGTAAGPEDAPVVELRSPDALRRLLWRPGELGAAQAYVTGELDVPGDLDAALTHAFEANIDAITALVDEELVRVWRLYLVGGSMAFRDGRRGVDQILLVRPGGAHHLPWTRSW